MTQRPDVSVIIPCYNYGQHLSECLNSVLSQETKRSFEVIVIDDASTDSTPSVLETFRDDRMTVIRHTRNKGHVASINEGFGRSTGRFVARLDADDRYRPHFFEQALARLEGTGAGLVYGNYNLIDGEGSITQEAADDRHGRAHFQGNELVELLAYHWICQPTVLSKRAAWEHVLPLPEFIGRSALDDWYFEVMIARRFDFAYCGSVLADYRVHGSNLHSCSVKFRDDESVMRRVLDEVFTTPEQRPGLESEKQRNKRRIYSTQYLTLAQKYFGADMFSDARRCYARALGFRPSLIGNPAVSRQLFGTMIGRRAYGSLKSILKGLSGR